MHEVFGMQRTWESCGLFQLTGTKAFELEPDEVEDVLRVTAMTLGFPFLPAALCWSPYLFPMIGVYQRQQKTFLKFNISKDYTFDVRI